jgi:hypothetical protein
MKHPKPVGNTWLDLSNSDLPRSFVQPTLHPEEKDSCELGVRKFPQGSRNYTQPWRITVNYSFGTVKGKTAEELCLNHLFPQHHSILFDFRA